MKSKGFTLIELIVSIAIVAIIALIMATTFLNGNNAVMNINSRSKDILSARKYGESLHLAKIDSNDASKNVSVDALNKHDHEWHEYHLIHENEASSSNYEYNLNLDFRTENNTQAANVDCKYEIYRVSTDKTSFYVPDFNMDDEIE